MTIFYSFQRKNMPSILFIILVLTVPALQTASPALTGWQGTGNMTGSNMTEIQTTIANYPITVTTTSAQLDTIAQAISLRLNELWAPAWNVVIVKVSVSNNDAVVYGYAFKDHWMWINGVTVSGSSGVFSYIIWKDYNCHTWSLFSNFITTTTTFTDAQTQTIGAFTFTGIETDVWGAAFSFVNYLNTQSSTKSGAYTIILSQHRSAIIRGYICMVNKNYASLKNVQIVGATAYGAYLLFQTR